MKNEKREINFVRHKWVHRKTMRIDEYEYELDSFFFVLKKSIDFE
jgi:hypothetical protein